MEDDLFVLGLQRGDAVDRARVLATRENELGMFFQQELLRSRDPIGLDGQLAFIVSTFRADDFSLEDVAHFVGVLFFDRVRVIPKIEVVHIAVVEPQADVVRMIDAFAGARLQRESPCHDGAVCGAERIEDGLGEIVGPDIGGEGLSVDDDVDAARGFVGQDLDSWRGCAVLFGEGEAKNQERGDGRCGCEDGCGVAHFGSLSLDASRAIATAAVNVSKKFDCGRAKGDQDRALRIR